MSDLLPAVVGVGGSALVVAGLVVAGRVARSTVARRRQTAELSWARHRLDAAARGARTAITTWLTVREGPLRDAVVAVHTGLDVVRDRRLGPPGQDLPDVADLDTLAAAYDAVGRLVTPVRDVLDRVAVVRDRLADLDGVGDAVPAELRDRVAAVLRAADDAAADLAATATASPAAAAVLTEAREGLERLARRSDQIAAEVYRRWSRRFPDRARQQGAGLVDAWFDAVRQEQRGRVRPPTDPPRHPTPQGDPYDDPPDDPDPTRPA